MKNLRPQDVGGMPVEVLHRLALVMPGVVTPSTEGISIQGRGTNPHGLSVRLLVDGANPGGFSQAWSGVEPHNPGSTMGLARRAEARRIARERLQTGRLGDFIWPNIRTARFIWSSARLASIGLSPCSPSSSGPVR